MKFPTAGTAGDRVFGGVGSTRPTLLNYLVDGTLILEVHMRTNKPGQQSASLVPENPFLRNAMVDLGDEETADVKIEVGGAVQNGAGRRKRGKTSTTFHAHHLVLRRNAPALADMCQPGNSSAPITINNVRPEIVKHLLFYCYGGKVDKEDLRSNAKDIIEAADRFDVVNLKLEAEACYVDTVELTLDNIIEIVTYADSKNLALLKEHCMDYLSRADKGEVAERVSFDDMPHLADEGFAGCDGEKREEIEQWRRAEHDASVRTSQIGTREGVGRGRLEGDVDRIDQGQ